MMNVAEQVEKTIRDRQLIAKGEGVLVAVSGGADSVCLLRVLCELQSKMDFCLVAAHVNHCLRGEDADADEAFVQNLCDWLHVPLVTARKDVQALATEQGIGLEEAGRLARYRFFDEVLKQAGLHKIATAHHADDNAETVLMRIIRGTGPTGLAGIPYKNGAVIRPLLDVKRQDIEAYLAELKQDFRTDATNNSCEFTRNRVRHQLLPLIEQGFNPNFRQTFQKQIKLYAECADYLEGQVTELLAKAGKRVAGGYSFLLDDLQYAPRFLVSQLYHKVIEELSSKECGQLAVRAVEEIVKRKEGSVTLSQDLIAVVVYGTLYIRTAAKEQSFSHPFHLETGTTVTETGDSFTVTSAEGVPEKPNACEMYIDVEKLEGKNLRVRSRETGDYFYPVGMQGKKTLQDYFVDSKIPFFMRDSIPLIAADEDIVWVAGMRADSRYAATQASKKIICVRYVQGGH